MHSVVQEEMLFNLHLRVKGVCINSKKQQIEQIYQSELVFTVLAIDIDPMKIQLARNNARIYGVEDRIEFILGNFFDIAPKLIADVVFLSPPWGGPGYVKSETYDLDNIMHPIGGIHVFKVARKITDHVAYFLPRNVDTMQVKVYTYKNNIV